MSCLGIRGRGLIGVWLLLAPIVLLPAGCRAPAEAPRNLILMIADGCGHAHVAATGLWAHGETGSLVFERFPVHLAVATPPHGAPSYDPDLVWSDPGAALHGATDSAAAITALGCGVKTRNGRLAVDPDGLPLTTFLEHAETRGLATGVVSSVMFAHATPAGLLVHNPDREDYAGIAASMIRESAAEVIMGPGHPWYDHDGGRLATPDFRYVGGEAVWEDLVAGRAGRPDPWTLVVERDDILALAEGPTPRRVLAVPPVRETLQEQRAGDVDADPFVAPRTETQPTLAEMTRAALNVLDDDPDGFALMIEGGAVDWASHENRSGRMIEEMLDFEAAVAAAAAWVETHGGWGETLIIVTADHECGGLHGPLETPADPWPEPVGQGRGVLPRMDWRSLGHTAQLVPLYARGAGAEALETLVEGDDPRHGPWLDNAALGRLLCAWARGSVEPEARVEVAAGS